MNHSDTISRHLAVDVLLVGIVVAVMKLESGDFITALITTGVAVLMALVVACAGRAIEH